MDHRRVAYLAGCALAILGLLGCVSPPMRVLEELRAPAADRPDHYRAPPEISSGAGGCRAAPCVPA